MKPPEEHIAEPIQRRRRSISYVWIVPMIAAAVAAYLVYERMQQAGPEIVIRFKDGSGLKPGQSPIKYRGVTVGEVRSIGLSPDLQTVEVRARLERSAASLAKEGTVFWIVRPELGVANVSGLHNHFRALH